MKILITGGSRGIGLATAELFRQNDAEVWICGRDAIRLSELEKSLGVRTTRADLGDMEQIDLLFAEIRKTWGRLDALVNNAADILVAPVEKMDPAQLRRLMDTNVLGLFRTCQNAIPLLRKGTHPAIVNVCSISGVWGQPKFPGFAAYCASKYAMLGLTEVLAQELRPDGIRVNAVSPGSVDTEMFRSNVPAGVNPDMTPREVAEAIDFLISDRSRAMNGRNLELF